MLCTFTALTCTSIKTSFILAVFKCFRPFFARRQERLAQPWSKISGFRIFYFVSWDHLSVYGISRFYDTGKWFRPYFSRHQGPLAPPLDRNFGFSKFFV